MVRPNNAAIGFTNWMLNISAQKLSGPQRLLVELVYNAAVAGTNITDQEWYNFNLFTAWRNPYYLVYRDYANYISPGLATNCICSYSFEGNGTDATGNFLATPSNILFGAPYGLINQGANFNGTTSYFTTGGLPLTNNSTVAFWINPSVASVGTNIILGNNTGGQLLGFSATASTAQLLIAPASCTIPSVPKGTWSLVTFVCNATHVLGYLNGVLVVTAAGAVPNSAFQYIGRNSSTINLKANLDIFTIWNRQLSASEILAFYNTAAGVQYPF